MSLRLNANEREFLGLVSQAIFANPFHADRAEIDARLAAVPGDSPDVLARVNARLAARLESIDLRRESGGDFESEADRELYEYGVLFEAFHRFSAQFDAFIEAQIKAGAKPAAVPFARELLSWLTTRSIPPARAERFFSLFFQLHRAHYFIARGLVGRSPAMGRLREALWNNVFTYDLRRFDALLWDRMEDFSTVILGATGSGKGAAAAAIGRSGFIPWDADRQRFAVSFTAGFVAINLSQYPETLIESELFGHKKGAFTGAVDSHAGVFSRCKAHGAIFLDEIGEVSIPVQIKLLRVLQEREFTPVGSHQSERFEGRVIAATHRSLDQLRADGRFRDDFWYRLCADVIQVPSLRTRIAEDLGELDDLLGVIVARILGGPSIEVATEVRMAIGRDLGIGYAWPGNVRELEQCVRRVLLTRQCVPDPTTRRGAASPIDSVLQSGTLSARQVVDRYCAMLYERHGTYEKVARIADLDRRTVKKHVIAGQVDE